MSIRTGFDEEEEKQQGRWEDMPQELLWNIIKRVEESETCWPSRLIQSCASVCKSWRAITKEVVETPEQSGRLTFPISLKQVTTMTSALYHLFKESHFSKIIVNVFL